MSDLENESKEVLPPKPKKTVKVKARNSVQEILKRSRQKVNTAEQSLRSAKRSAEYLKGKYKIVNSALQGKETQIIEQDKIDTVSPNVKAHLKSQNIVFKPNTGPQTDFLAASEREVFYG